MIISLLQKKLKDVPISRKLYFTIGIMAFLVTVELFTLWFALSTLSAARSYVGGEGLWSKAEKDAVYHLSIYATLHNEKDYQAFREFLKVPLGAKKARLELVKPNPDLQITRQGLLAGRNHPADISGMINLIKHFRNTYYISNAAVIWGQADQKIEQLVPVGKKMHDLINSKTASQQQINQLLGQVETLNIKLTNLEDAFSSTLGEGCRWLESLVLKLLLSLSLTIASISILITISVSQGIEKGLKTIINGATNIGEGQLSTRVEVYSSDEIGTLAISFNRMTDMLEHYFDELKATEENLKQEKERAEASEKAKQLFLANMSHEIRTPMNGILGFAKLLEESLKDKEQREYIRVIIKSGDDLLVILNDILDFSRIEAGKITFESQPFNLRDIFQSIIMMMGAKCRQKNIGLDYQIDQGIPEMIMGDSVRLNQILVNLISNAIKFTEKGGINISVFCVAEAANNIQLEFKVKDTGIGIPLDKQQKIFESFEQASVDTGRKYGGTGLRLSIVKQLVELQNGEISVNSQPGAGSELYFRLSFLKVETKTINVNSVKTVPIVFPGKNIRVLIVEDNLINQLLVVKVLQQQGLVTDVAENGKIALTKHIENKYNVILMDLQMPEMDGYEVTKSIRNLGAAKRNIPIIAMTAHTIKGELEHCLDAGMNEFISKPFNKEELLEKICSAVAVNTISIEQ